VVVGRRSSVVGRKSGSWVVGRGSWGSWAWVVVIVGVVVVVGLESSDVGRGLWVVGRRSWVVRGSWSSDVDGRRGRRSSSVFGRQSLVVGRGRSSVVGRRRGCRRESWVVLWSWRGRGSGRGVGCGRLVVGRGSSDVSRWSWVVGRGRRSSMVDEVIGRWVKG